MEFSTIIFEKQENFAIITLNRPDKLNALNNQLFTELDQIITEVEKDAGIKALILTGSGEKAFAAGADITELHECDTRTGKLFSEFGSGVMARLENLSIPVIAAVNGFALGGGCELTLACHIRYASNNAKFGQPEVNLGIIPGYGGTQRLPKIVGKARAIELILTGDLIGADEAYRIGLVNKVFEVGELLPKTIELVNKMLTKGTLALSAAVDAINASERLSPKEGLDYESRLFGRTCGTSDFKEGTLAFIEKRKANFDGN
ncbi:MAG: enoyl-CoA hydratase-related protein [Candidatus Kapabacteria bacterium]|nr:enoyl-CoA hydratase-related protein [Candidatus Kapabacteria bacterium]